MKSTYKLKIVAQPIHGTRSVISPDSKDSLLVLKGANSSAPDLTCGGCNSVLVAGMRREQFTKSQGITPLLINLGTFRITETLQTHDVSIGTENGPLIIKCPKCSGYNEVDPSDPGWRSG